ncbi:DUF1993 family protein [Paraglaciecola hydrolytica]|uniref:DUF1993 domain-containing protein n=1 Tax=Paraglaciecola hydrolytica TaxID=1799789 RepID=A0A148KNH9_9ALTE|nr:DUF1993 domain-containing protein [Paraglaciecola hydrolytica]KXI27788.1 hypothetical protein AX660_19840 [Paraglaciecola hydrolytica]
MNSVVSYCHLSIFTDYLSQLSHLLDKIECNQRDDTNILEARLVADMLPLGAQVEIAASFALRASCPIAQVEMLSFAKSERSFASLQSQLQQTIGFLKELMGKNTVQFVGEISDMAGPVKVTMPADEFLQRFALPNFFFHISMVYAIARMRGIPVSKGDFDGIHQYAMGFSFEK